MNRFFRQFRLGLEAQVVDLFAKVAIGASGAPTIDAKHSLGIASITRNSAGDYTIVLQDRYVRLVDFKVMSLSSTGLPAAPDTGLKALSVSTSSKSVEFVTSTGGVATDPASGETLYIAISLSRSTAI